MNADETKNPRPRRRAWGLAALTLVGLTLFLTWRATTLSGLPDIGDPFDVDAFDVEVADDRNAFILYRQAVDRMVKEPHSRVTGVWATAGVAERRWLDDNREALALWRLGTDRPDSLHARARTSTFETVLKTSQNLRGFARLATLEATRLEAEGDFAGAWVWHHALLRSSRHLGRRGCFIDRLIGIAIHSVSSARINHWAAEPKIDASSLRRALDEVIAIDAMTPPDSDAIKWEYLSFLNSMNDPKLMDSVALLNSPRGPSLGPAVRRSIDSALRIFKREPERSRRVIRLVFANWLAYCDLPAATRPKLLGPNPAASNGATPPTLNGLYATDPSAPANARALPPEVLARWFDSTLYAKQCLPAKFAVDMALARERSVQANLVVTLANELHKREHGDYPAKAEDLVGPYLKALPEGIPTSR